MVKVLKLKSRLLLLAELAMCMVAVMIAMTLRYPSPGMLLVQHDDDLIIKAILYVGILGTAIFLNDLYQLQILAHKRRLLPRLAKMTIVAVLMYGVSMAILPDQTQGRLVFAFALFLINVFLVGLFVLCRPAFESRALREQVLVLGDSGLAKVLRLELTRGDYRQSLAADPAVEQDVLETLCLAGEDKVGAERLERCCQDIDLVVLAISPDVHPEREVGDGAATPPANPPGVIHLNGHLNGHRGSRRRAHWYSGSQDSQRPASRCERHDLERLLRGLVALKLSGVQVLHAMDYYEQLTGRVYLQDEADPLFFSQSQFRIDKLSLMIKNCWEWLLACAMLLLALPWMFIVPIAILLDSGRPLLFIQPRVGRNGKVYRLFKWRSMDESGNVTFIGKIIRKTKLDELPQLINVLRGEMSLVGPRPEMPQFVQRFDQDNTYYALRHVVKPGLTGWAQIMFPDARAEDAIIKLSFDLYYVKHFSLISDMVIMAETFKMIVFGGITRAMRHKRHGLKPSGGQPEPEPTRAKASAPQEVTGDTSRLQGQV